jgi:hypothetical protein
MKTAEDAEYAEEDLANLITEVRFGACIRRIFLDLLGVLCVLGG